MDNPEKRLRELAAFIDEQGEALWISPKLIEIAEEVECLRQKLGRHVKAPMSDSSLSKFSIEDLQRLQKQAHKLAREAPRSSPDAPSSAWAHQSGEWGRYVEELKQRGVEPEPLE